MVLFLAHFKLNVSFGNCFHFSSSVQLVQHMLILPVPHILLVRHQRFGIVAYRRINRFLQYLLEIKGGG